MKPSNLLLIILVIGLFGCSGTSNKEQNAQVLDEEVQVAATVNVDDLLQDPDKFIGQKIQITGLVTHVCKHSGKRLHLTSAETNQMIRVEAAEGINQFQRELEGSNIVVAGIMQKEVINEDYLAKWENELKGESHESHSEAEQMENEEQIKNMRQRLADSGQSELVSYWLDGNSFTAE